jgi:hypothetical protein
MILYSQLVQTQKYSYLTTLFIIFCFISEVLYDWTSPKCDFYFSTIVALGLICEAVHFILLTKGFNKSDLFYGIGFLFVFFIFIIFEIYISFYSGSSHISTLQNVGFFLYAFALCFFGWRGVCTSKTLSKGK